jgi:hypothetical protein
MIPEWYRGMTYKQASTEAAMLIVKAAHEGYWFTLPERLIFLRDVMRREATVDATRRMVLDLFLYQEIGI